MSEAKTYESRTTHEAFVSVAHMTRREFEAQRRVFIAKEAQRVVDHLRVTPYPVRVRHLIRQLGLQSSPVGLSRALGQHPEIEPDRDWRTNWNHHTTWKHRIWSQRFPERADRATRFQGPA